MSILVGRVGIRFVQTITPPVPTRAAVDRFARAGRVDSFYNRSSSDYYRRLLTILRLRCPRTSFAGGKKQIYARLHARTDNICICIHMYVHYCRCHYLNHVVQRFFGAQTQTVLELSHRRRRFKDNIWRKVLRRRIN